MLRERDESERELNGDVVKFGESGRKWYDIRAETVRDIYRDGERQKERQRQG